MENEPSDPHLDAWGLDVKNFRKINQCNAELGFIRRKITHAYIKVQIEERDEACLSILGIAKYI